MQKYTYITCLKEFWVLLPQVYRKGTKYCSAFHVDIRRLLKREKKSSFNAKFSGVILWGEYMFMKLHDIRLY